MSELTPIQGELQAQIMAALWGLGAGTVEQVRAALPRRYRGAYNTVQTVLNRLTERGLLSRKRRGSAFVYRARVSEAEYLSRSIELTLSGASPRARNAAIAQLIGALEPGELSDLQHLARDAQRKRRRSP